MTIPPGRPPRLPSTAIRIPHAAAVPAALSPMSRAISQRRASRASPVRTTTTPSEPAWYTTVTSHVMLRGGGWITWVMARSIRESYRMTSRQHTRMRTAAASRTPSLPRRRRWPLPTGANMTERQLHGPLVHIPAADDQVDQDADQRDEQHENKPQCLRPAGQVPAAEDVDEDIDQNPD